MIEPGPTHCERCRRPIPPDAPGGLCPNCLFSAQLPGNASTLTGGLPGGGDVPDWAEGWRSLPFPTDTNIGPYRLLEEIGRGGMGVVYRARHEQLDRYVAIKMILAGCAADPRRLEAFLSEAKAAARVRHPNVVGIHEVGHWQGQHCMVMELVAGKSLLEHARAASVTPDDAARIIRDVATAMSYLHHQGIVHRDIKPSNILIDADGIPYVTDFGLAKVRALSTGLTTEGPCAGTPNYMSPEQAMGAPERLGPATDVFSLGVVLYELLAGRPPFRGESIPETLLQVVRREPEPPRRIRPDLSGELDCICMKCLEKNPANRYPDMAALAADLERYLDGEAIAAKSFTAPQRVRRWWRRNPALAARYLSLWLFFAIEQIWRLVLGVTSRDLYLTTTIVVPLWAVVTYLFARILRQGIRKEELVRSLWITADTAFLTGILLNSDGFQQSPLVMLFPIYIAGASLFNRVRGVWLATVLCILSDLVLYASAPLLREERAELLHVHLVFIAGLIVLALILSHQVRQVRVMRRYLRQQQPPAS